MTIKNSHLKTNGGININHTIKAEIKKKLIINVFGEITTVLTNW